MHPVGIVWMITLFKSKKGKESKLGIFPDENVGCSEVAMGHATYIISMKIVGDGVIRA